MKPLKSLVMALLLGHSVRANPSREEFVIEAIQESEEVTGIQENAPVRPLPAVPPSQVANESTIPSKLIEVVQGSRKLV